MSPLDLKTAVTTILDLRAAPGIASDDLVHAVVEMVANRGVWGVPAEGEQWVREPILKDRRAPKSRPRFAHSLQTIPVSPETFQAVAHMVSGPTVETQVNGKAVRLPDVAAMHSLKEAFREALFSIIQGKRNVTARHPYFADAVNRVVIRPRFTEEGDRYDYFPESHVALVARVLAMVESNEEYRNDLRQCQLSALLRELGKPDDGRGCNQFYFMSLRRQQKTTITGSKRRTETGGRDPSTYCCKEHTLAARRVLETWRKQDIRRGGTGRRPSEASPRKPSKHR